MGTGPVRPAPHHQQGYVVPGRLVADQRAHHLGAGSFRGLRHDDPAQAFQPVVNQLARPLDQAVGVEATAGRRAGPARWSPAVAQRQRPRSSARWRWGPGTPAGPGAR